MSTKTRHALVFGASGLIGWGIVDQLLSNCPSPGTFAQVTALVNRPLELQDFFWPLPAGHPLNVQDSPEQPELQLVSGINLADRTVDGVTELLQAKVKGSQYITHVYHFGMPKTLNYPFMRAELELATAGKQWTWCDIRPDAVIGFVPNGSAFKLTAHWATYLSIYRAIEGPDAKVHFPGSFKGYEALYNEASADIIAKLAIFASLHPNEVGGGHIFNIADQAKPESMKERWPKLAAYFGLQGVAPVEGEDKIQKPSDYINEHRAQAERLGMKCSPVFEGGFLDSYGFYLDFDRQLREGEGDGVRRGA
ncbi:MAG: hypothetical protein Q9169_000807 [Polycauliona sp. 2 TL-2023]